MQPLVAGLGAVGVERLTPRPGLHSDLVGRAVRRGFDECHLRHLYVFCRSGRAGLIEAAHDHRGRLDRDTSVRQSGGERRVVGSEHRPVEVGARADRGAHLHPTARFGGRDPRESLDHVGAAFQSHAEREPVAADPVPGPVAYFARGRRPQCVEEPSRFFDGHGERAQLPVRGDAHGPSENGDRHRGELLAHSPHRLQNRPHVVHGSIVT